MNNGCLVVEVTGPDLHVEVTTPGPQGPAGLGVLPTYATVDRPDPGDAGAGSVIFDTDLAQPVFSDGTDWRDASGSIV